MRVRVIEDASARYGYTSFIIVQVDHFGICELKEKTNSSYLALVDLIEDVVGDKSTSTPHTNDAVQLETGELKSKVNVATNKLCCRREFK